MTVDPPEIPIEIHSQPHLIDRLHEAAHFLHDVRVYPVQQQALNNTKRHRPSISQTHTTPCNIQVLAHVTYT